MVLDLFMYMYVYIHRCNHGDVCMRPVPAPYLVGHCVVEPDQVIRGKWSRCLVSIK